MTFSIVASSDQLAVKEYELIRCFNAQSKQSEVQKILDEKWSHHLEVAKQHMS